jgi:hypothetical protein
MNFQELINALLFAAVFVLFGQVLDIWDKLDRYSEFMGKLHDRITKLENENERTDRKHEENHAGLE